MTTVNNTSSTSAADIFAAINGSSGTASTSSTSTATAMGDKFLTLLMTQIKNQDPLNPMDNAQMTTQLAEINTVNGISQLNATLSKLLDGYNNSQAMQAAGIIGKNVLVAGSQLALSNGAAAGGFKLDSAADSVQVQVLDTYGNVVRSENLGAQNAGNSTFVWDGKNNAGTTVADGNYKFSVTATQSGKAVTATTLQLGTVNAVSRNSNGFVLDLGSAGDVAFTDVQEIF